MTDTDKLVDRISKLIAKAEGTDNQAEAETFMAKAQELMLNHSIEAAQLRAHNHNGGIRPVTEIIEVARTWFMPTAHLIAAIADANHCQIWYASPSQWGGGPGKVHVLGFQEDVDNVKYLYTSLLVQLTRFTRGMKSDNWGVSDAQYRRSFRYGFAQAIGRRLKEAHATAVADHEDPTSVALILADKDSQVAAAMPSGLGKSRSTRVAAEGYRDGTRAAERADVGSARVGAGLRALGR